MKLSEREKSKRMNAKQRRRGKTQAAKTKNGRVLKQATQRAKERIRTRNEARRAAELLRVSSTIQAADSKWRSELSLGEALRTLSLEEMLKAAIRALAHPNLLRKRGF